MQYEVIIAEDEELILNNLIQKVNAHPAFKVIGSAQTGTDALDLVKEHSPILLMTDIRMPVMDGMELLSRVRECYQSYFSEDYTHISPVKIARLLHEFITTHYQDSLNLSIIAQTMNYSQSYLTKIFLQEYNCTPIKYLNSLRLKKACSFLLYNPELTISQIATLTGYEDQAYFSRTFKTLIFFHPSVICQKTYDMCDKNSTDFEIHIHRRSPLQINT